MESALDHEEDEHSLHHNDMAAADDDGDHDDDEEERIRCRSRSAGSCPPWEDVAPCVLRVGCVGGGMYGKMMALEAAQLHMGMSFLDPQGMSCAAARAVPNAAPKETTTSPPSPTPTPTSSMHASLGVLEVSRNLVHGNTAAAATPPPPVPTTPATGRIVQGGLDDEAKIRELAEGCDVVTLETEHVGIDQLATLEEEGMVVQPASRVVLITQDKFVQKEYFRAHNLPLAPFVDTPTIASIEEAANSIGLPLVLKKRRGWKGRRGGGAGGGAGGAGGSGGHASSSMGDSSFPDSSRADEDASISGSSSSKVGSFFRRNFPRLANGFKSGDANAQEEDWNKKRKQSKAVLWDTAPEVLYAALETMGIRVPVHSSGSDAADGAAGLAAVEMGGLDLYAEGEINFHAQVVVLVVRTLEGHTETYPPAAVVHVDGHCRLVLAPAPSISQATRDECVAVATRAVASLGVGACGVFGVELFVVQNEGKMDVFLNKVTPRPHLAGFYTQDACAVSQFQNHLRAVCDLPLGDTHLMVGAAATIYMLRSDSDKGVEQVEEETMKRIRAALLIPRASLHWYGDVDEPDRAGGGMATDFSSDIVGHITLTANSLGELEGPLAELLDAEKLPRDIVPRASGLGPANKKSPLVGVLLGAASDLPALQPALEVLGLFDIPVEVDVVSAHRTPDKAMAFGKDAASRGMQVLIAAASSYLPGMVASVTTLPVIGVRLSQNNNGQSDEEPRGLPVACVSHALNAGLMAIRILASTRPVLQQALDQFQLNLKTPVEQASAQLLVMGHEKYLERLSGGRRGSSCSILEKGSRHRSPPQDDNNDEDEEITAVLRRSYPS